MTDSFEKEVIERLTKIETKLDRVDSMNDKVSTLETSVALLQDNVKKLQDLNKVFTGAIVTIGTTLIVSIVKFILKI